MQRLKQVKLLRNIRKVHRIVGVFLFIAFIVMSISGLLLGIKKHSGGIILSKSRIGSNLDMSKFLSIDSLNSLANNYLHSKVSAALSADVDRIEIRQDKGMIKFTFKEHYYALQIDATTGELLHVERRYADLIENIHDASILDKVFNTDGEPIKLIYTIVMALSLLIFSITGFWMWLGPKILRRKIRRLSISR